MRIIVANFSISAKEKQAGKTATTNYHQLTHFATKTTDRLAGPTAVGTKKQDNPPPVRTN